MRHLGGYPPRRVHAPNRPTPLWHIGSGTCWSGLGGAVIQTAVKRYILSLAVALTPWSSSRWPASHPSCYPLVGLGPVPILLLLLLCTYRLPWVPPSQAPAPAHTSTHQHLLHLPPSQPVRVPVLSCGIILFRLCQNVSNFHAAAPSVDLDSDLSTLHYNHIAPGPLTCPPSAASQRSACSTFSPSICPALHTAHCTAPVLQATCDRLSQTSRSGPAQSSPTQTNRNQSCFNSTFADRHIPTHRLSSHPTTSWKAQHHLSLCTSSHSRVHLLTQHGCTWGPVSEGLCTSILHPPRQRMAGGCRPPSLLRGLCKSG